jgi:hypothetical protein
MTDHHGYSNADILCGTCRSAMVLSRLNRPNCEPGTPIQWRVVCGNQVCFHFGVTYEVQPNIDLKRVEE